MVCASRIQRRHPGCARARRFRRRVLSLPARGARRGGDDRVASQAARIERPHRHVRLFLPGDDAIARRRRTARRLGLHCAGHDGVRSLPRLVLSPWCAAPRLTLGLGTANAEGGRAPPAFARSERSARKRWANLAAQTGVLPFREHPALHGGRFAADTCWIGSIMPSPANIGSRSTSAGTLDRIRVPALHVSGWYDTYLKGSVDGFLALTKCAGSAAARQNQYLVAGPWVHIPWGDRVGTADFGSEALLDTDSLLLRWFNHWLKDSGEFATEPHIRHFVLGENRWRQAEEFPSEPDLCALSAQRRASEFPQRRWRARRGCARA